MKLPSKILQFLLPTAKLLLFPEWIPLWEEKQLRSYVILSRVLYGTSAVGYLVHYYWIDLPLHLVPRERWFYYRFGMSALCALLFFTTFFAKLQSNRIFMFTLGIVMCSLQSTTLLWFSGVPYLYSFVMSTFMALFLQKPVGPSLLYLLLLYCIQWPILRAASLSPEYIISSMVISIIIVVMIRSRMTFEVEAFITEQVHLETQTKLIESEMELNEQIRSFLPGEVYDRMMNLIRKSNMTVLQAMDEVLKPRLKQTAFVFSDIRGYTQKTKNIIGFIDQSVTPNIRACAELVEHHRGIPKIIGDLIFCFFDHVEGRQNLIRALQCALEFFDLNQSMNSTLNQDLRLKRFILLSYGEALVGNVGGIDGSREICALGTPANILSRIDELTKHPVVVPLLDAESLILSMNFAEESLLILPKIDLKWIDLHSHQIQIRDFPEERFIVLLPLNLSNRNLISAAQTI